MTRFRLLPPALLPLALLMPLAWAQPVAAPDTAAPVAVVTPPATPAADAAAMAPAQAVVTPPAAPAGDPAATAPAQAVVTPPATPAADPAATAPAQAVVTPPAAPAADPAAPAPAQAVVTPPAAPAADPAATAPAQAVVTPPTTPAATPAAATGTTPTVPPAAAAGTTSPATPASPPPQVVAEEPPRPPQDPNLPIGMDQTACPYLVGPFAQGQVANPSEAWNGTDTGVVVNGHVALRGADGRPLRTLLGIDLSSHNRPDYRLLARCGTAFSFVRMDDKYNTHATELDRLNVRPLPYYFLNVPSSLRNPALYNNLSDTPASQAAIDAHLATFQKLGEDGVQTFMDRMRRLGMREMPVVTVRNPDLSIRSQARVLAVDIEQKLEPEPPNDTARIYYGRFYAKAVCAWVKGVQDALPGTLVLMYTTPSVWGEYLYAAYPQEAACLNAMPIWVARTTVDGGDVIRSSRSKIDLYTARLCTASGSNRCVVHQYSHRGLLGLAPPLERGRATHFDLNRFFLVQPVQTGAGIMFVREQ